MRRGPFLLLTLMAIGTTLPFVLDQPVDAQSPVSQISVTPTLESSSIAAEARSYEELSDNLKLMADRGEITYSSAPEKEGYVRINPVTGREEVWRLGMSSDSEKAEEAGWLEQVAVGNWGNGMIVLEAPAGYFEDRGVELVGEFTDEFLHDFDAWQEEHLSNGLDEKIVRIQLVKEFDPKKDKQGFLQVLYHRTGGVVGHAMWVTRVSPDSINIRGYSSPVDKALELWDTSCLILESLKAATLDNPNANEELVKVFNSNWAASVKEIVFTPPYGTSFDQYGTIFQ